MVDEGKRLIITVLGHDRVGIIAAIATILAEANVNILDISQTILQGFFTMVMVVDTTSSTIEVGSLRERLTEKGLGNYFSNLQYLIHMLFQSVIQIKIVFFRP